MFRSRSIKSTVNKIINYVATGISEDCLVFYNIAILIARRAFIPDKHRSDWISLPKAWVFPFIFYPVPFYVIDRQLYEYPNKRDRFEGTSDLWQGH